MVRVQAVGSFDSLSLILTRAQSIVRVNPPDNQHILF
jgi:hypothetical protein